MYGMRRPGAIRAAGGRSLVTLAAALAAVFILAVPANAATPEAAGFDAGHRVTFRSGATPANRSQFNKPHDTIAGYLYRPEGNGPFPAVVLTTDNQGLHPMQRQWATRLVAWGYVALVVDSQDRSGIFTPSALSSAHDAYGALKHLASQPYVDPGRVSWIGWSYFGGSALLDPGMEADPGDARKPLALLVSEGPWRFSSGIAFYPPCPSVKKAYYAPMLLLVPKKGSRRLQQCEMLAEQATAAGGPVRIKLYPDATHRFDMPGVTVDQYGDLAEYNAAATEDAIVQVKAFLAEDRPEGWGGYLIDLARRGWRWVRGN